MRRTISLLLIATTLAALAGCASQSPVIEQADGSFTTQAFGHPRVARTKAFEVAQEHCQKSGQRAVLVDSSEKMVTGQVSTYNANANVNRYSGYGAANGSSIPVVSSNSTISFICK